jgi:predicted O-methyltransferase YrrM
MAGLENVEYPGIPDTRKTALLSEKKREKEREKRIEKKERKERKKRRKENYLSSINKRTILSLCPLLVGYSTMYMANVLPQDFFRDFSKICSE